MILSSKACWSTLRASADGSNLDLAIEHYTEAASICREHGWTMACPRCWQPRPSGGRVRSRRRRGRPRHGCLRRSWEKGIVPVAAFAVIVIAQGHLAEGDIERGLRMIGTVMADPRTEGNSARR